MVATAYEVPRVAAAGERPSRDVPIGRPLPHARAYVLDEHLNPCPVGVTGELYLGGAGLARGYLGRPDLTAACFIADPFARERGARLYRTGDLARYLPDGNLVFVGRRDRQIKIRGYRIEPGEIEAALLQHPAVREAFVTVQPNATGEATLIAYVAPHVEGLRRWLDERLPPHMLPAAIVLLDTLPVTPGGKVDAAALSPADTGAQASMQPRTPAEELVSGVVADVLGLPEVGRDDSFFALGGHSLLAARVIARLCEAFGVDLPLAALFESPTVAGLASAVERARRESTPSARTPIPVVDAEGETPLSPAQAPIWRAARALPGVPLFAIPTLLRLEGPLDIDLLQRSLTELTRRHRILSAVVAERGGEPVLVPQPPTRFALPVVDSPGPARKPARRSAPGAGRRGAGHAVRSAQRAAAAGGVGPVGAGGAHAVPDPASHRGGRRIGRGPGRGTGSHLRGVRGRPRRAAARSCAPIRRLGALATGVAAESRGAGAARLLAEATRRRARSSRSAHRPAAHHSAHLSLRTRDAASWPRR